MFPVVAMALTALAAIWGTVEQLWPSAVGVPMGVQGGKDVWDLARPLYSGWGMTGQNVINLNNSTLQAKEMITHRRLQFGQCSASDRQQMMDGYNRRCASYCEPYPYKVDVSNCSPSISFTLGGPTSTACSCDATCSCQADYRGLIIPALENLVWVLFQFAVAACLWGGIKQAGQSDPIPLVGSGADFESGVCDCGNDCHTCCCGLFCPVIRASQTLYAASMWGFWSAMLLYGVGFALPVFAGWWVVFFLMRFCFRMQLRQKAGLQPDCLNDCCCTFWCGPCTVCQEARHMDKALMAFKSVAGPVGGPVGGPVVVGAVVAQMNQS